MHTESLQYDIHGWKNISPVLQRFIIQHARRRSASAGTVLFHQGAVAEVVAWTMDGLVFTRVNHDSGGQTLLNHIPPGRLILFNFMWKNEALDREFYAMTNVELLVLPKRNMVQLLAQHDELKMLVIDSLTRNIDDLTQVMFTHKAASREANVARFLLDCEVSRQRDGSAAVPLSMQFMAECLRLSRPFIAKTLKDFAERLLITMRYGAITVLDRKGLRRIAGE